MPDNPILQKQHLGSCILLRLVSAADHERQHEQHNQGIVEELLLHTHRLVQRVQGTRSWTWERSASRFELFRPPKVQLTV